jgi:hypothetical protein
VIATKKRDREFSSFVFFFIHVTSFLGFGIENLFQHLAAEPWL